MTGVARTIGDLFVSEPGNIFPLLTRTNRLDMIDYYNSGQQVAVPNNLAGESRLLEMDSVYLKVQTSGNR
jgi:ABC-type metal ion transport system substrate-binding protein